MKRFAQIMMAAALVGVMTAPASAQETERHPPQQAPGKHRVHRYPGKVVIVSAIAVITWGLVVAPRLGR